MKNAFIQRTCLYLTLANQGLIDIFFADETAFSLAPYIPYCYQKKGTQLAIPSVRTSVLKVLGFLNPITKQLVTYNLPEKTNLDSELFIKFMSDFASKITRTTIVVLDNASPHKSALTKAMFSTWEEQGLFIQFLPPRCPHLNPIEILWRRMKYSWFSVSDYRSKKRLLKKINYIFKNFGNSYDISFTLKVFNEHLNM